MIRFHARRVRLVVLAALLIVVLPRPSYAYLDPGSASYTLQMLIALALSAAFLLKTYWAKLKRFLSGLLSRSQKREGELRESPPRDSQ